MNGPLGHTRTNPDTSKTARAAAATAGTPGLTPTAMEAPNSMTDPGDNFTTRARQASEWVIRAARAEIASHEAAQTYHLRCALAHGCTVAQVADWAGLPTAAVLARTEPLGGVA